MNPNRTESELKNAIVELEMVSPEEVVHALEAMIMNLDAREMVSWDSTQVYSLPWEKERAQILLNSMQLSNGALDELKQIETANYAINWSTIISSSTENS